MVCVCVVTTFSMFDDPPCKKRIMSQLFGHHNLNAIVCTYYVVLDRVDSLTKRFLFVPINDKIDSINGLAAAVWTQHSFCKDSNSNASKNLYITSTHIIQVTLQHIPAKIGFAETIGFMQGRKPLIVSKGRTTGLVWWPAYTYTLLLQEWPALMQPPLVYGHQVARITLLRPQPCGKTS